MKKTVLVVALAVLGGALFAQAPGRGMGPGMGPGGINWTIGTVVTSEYKKVTGTVSIGQTLAPTFKAGNVEYQLRLPRTPEVNALKNGDSVTIEGVFTTVKSDTAQAPSVQVFKITIGGKEIDLSQFEGRGKMRGNDDNDPFGQGGNNGQGNNGGRR